MKNVGCRQSPRGGSLASGEKQERLAPSDVALYRNLIPWQNRVDGGILFRRLAATITIKHRTKTGKAFLFFE
jgi:hypothetical protein